MKLGQLFWFFCVLCIGAGFCSVLLLLGLIVVEGRVVFLVAWLFSMLGNSSAYNFCAKIA